MSQKDILTEEEAAKLLQIRPQTLALWRCSGRYAIPFVRLGPKLIRYRREDLDAFLESRSVKPKVATVG